MRARLWLFFFALSLSACHSGSVTMTMPDAGPIQINQIPTGTIKTPSLCDRVQVDAQVTSFGVDSFAFAWSTDHYQVVYVDLAAHNVYSLRLDESGVPMGIAQIVEQGGGAASQPNLLATSTGFIVTWEEASTPPRVRVRALDASGNPTGSITQIATARGTQMRPVLSASPNGTAIAWMDQVEGSAATTHDVGVSTTYVALLDAQLNVRTDVPVRQIDAALSTGYPWLAGDANSLALLWSEQIGTTTIDTYFTLLDSTLTPGTIVDVRNTPGATSSALLGRMTQTSFGYIGAWEDSRTGSEEIYMSLLKPAGTIYGGGLVEEPGTGSANWPHIAWTGSAIAVVYYQFRSGKPQVFMTFIDENGMRLGGGADAQISDTTEWSRYPDVVWTGSEFGVLWIDARSGQPQLYYNRATCKVPAPV